MYYKQTKDMHWLLLQEEKTIEVKKRKKQSLYV